MLYEASVADVFRLKKDKVKIPKDGLGIEVEVEFPTPFSYTEMPVGEDWMVKTDGSLRNFGLEFVTKPFSAGDINNVVGKQWGNLLFDKYMKTRNDDCPRASVHVHVNVKEFTYNQLMNAIVAYLLVEGVLVDFCGKYRKGNLFALRVPEASGNFRSLRSSVKKYESLRVNGEHRYGAMNLCSLSRFGTLEFRSMGSNYEPEAIILWSLGLRNLVDHAAQNFKNPPAVYDHYTRVSREQFIEEFLGKLGQAILKKPVDEELFFDGEDCAIDLLATSPDNWSYDEDFRKNEEFLKYVRDQNGPGWRNPEILQSTQSQFESVMNTINSNKGSRMPRIGRSTAGDFDPDPATGVDFGQIANSARVMQSFADTIIPRRTRDPIRATESTPNPNEDTLPRGRRTIRWTGTIPREAFFSDNQYRRYLDDADRVGEPTARSEADRLNQIRDSWVGLRSREFWETQDQQASPPAAFPSPFTVSVAPPSPARRINPFGARSQPEFITFNEAGGFVQPDEEGEPDES